MPDLLLELRSEEIPARMQRKAAGDLRKMVTDGLVDAGLTYEAAREYWTPRRLALDLRGLTARSKDVREERKGPSVKAPRAAIDGFLRSAGLTDVSQAEIQSDPKKGDFYVARTPKPGRAAEAVIAELVPKVIRGFPWPKSMRWGPASGPKGRRYGGEAGQGGETLRWVRPLQSIVCTFGPETEEPVVVDFEVGGIRSGNVTWGHRFHAPGAITVSRFDDYAAKLEAANVVVDAERRKAIILEDARTLAFANGLELVEDEGLLEEVSGLVEWPVVLMGEFEPDFLVVPPEVIRLTIRANQKCFVMRPQALAPSLPFDGGEERSTEGREKANDLAFSATNARSASEGPRAQATKGGAVPQTSRSVPPPSTLPGISPTGEEISQSPLAPRFVLTANIAASDGGDEIVRGNGKVVRARLSDALYFWKTDQADLPDLDALKPSADKFGLKRDASGKLLPLDQRMARLDHLGVTFHAKLGTQGERVQRIARLAEELAPVVMKAISPPVGEMGGSPEGGAVPQTFQATNAESERSTLPPSALPGISPTGGEISSLARRAALLAKADLTTEIVGEFPELQGVMGRKYAALQGEHPSVAAAIEDHYRPQGPSDRVPTDPFAICVALADKLDTLVGFWAIDEKPTGSKDPFALRRAALGVIRIVVENNIRTSIYKVGFIQQCLLIRNGWEVEHDFRDLLRRYDPATESQPTPNWSDEPYFGLLDGDGFLDRNGEGISWAQMGHVDLSGDPTDEPIGLEREHVFEQLEQRLQSLQYLEESTWFENLDDPDAPRGFDVFLIEANKLGWLRRRFDTVSKDLLSFFHDRLKIYLRDKGARHDLIDAVLAAGSLPLEGVRRTGETSGSPQVVREADRVGLPATGATSSAKKVEAASATPPGGSAATLPSRGREPAAPSAEGRKPKGASASQAAPAEAGERSEPPAVSENNDDLLVIVRKVEALGALLATDDGRNLLAGAKRAANILAAEEKKGTPIADAVDPALFTSDAERALFDAVNQAESKAGQAIQAEDFSAAMRELAALREPVDSFFEQVLVNDEDAAIRANRLALLSRIRAATGAVADFSKIAG